MTRPAPGAMYACRPWSVKPEMCCPDWPTPWPIPCDMPPEEVTPEMHRAEWAVAVASQKLHVLSGYRWGLCEDVLRPCGPVRCQPAQHPLFGPQAGMQGACGCGCSDCDTLSTINLPGPVHQVLEVVIDGRPLTEWTDWMVNAEGSLVALNCYWPCSQDMSVGCGQKGSFCVRYLRGIDPSCDLLAIQAVSALACETYHGACGTKSCSTSMRGVRSVKRDGVEYQKVPGPRDTGVPVVDDWLDLINPRRVLSPPRLLSPDVRRWRFRGASERGSTCS